MEQEYLEYAGELSLSLLAISAAYFFDPSRLWSFTSLLMIPVLFGFTAYVSRDGFRPSSLLAAVALFFSPLSYLMAGISIVVALGNPLVSFFSPGEGFNSYYSSTTIPLFLTGLVIGLLAFASATVDDGTATEIRDGAGEFLGNYTERIVEESGLVQEQREAQLSVMKRASEATVTATRVYVLNDTRDELERDDEVAVSGAFRSASRDVPEMFSSRNINSSSVDISGRVETAVDSNLRGKAFIVLIPLATFGLYSLQPVTGILTAIFASLVSFVASRRE